MPFPKKKYNEDFELDLRNANHFDFIYHHICLKCSGRTFDFYFCDKNKLSIEIMHICIFCNFTFIDTHNFPLEIIEKLHKLVSKCRFTDIQDIVYGMDVKRIPY